MSGYFSNRKTKPVLAVIGMVLIVGLTAASLEAGVAKLFTGGGYGATAANAVRAAIEDAENSASSEGLYTCELVGEPLIFPRRGRFNAEATVSCTP